ncbi:uncharacterized protein EAF02_000889 [Botrytis sinoallii]|uniref:uncharacterized protein n=1 Tax=Botrytis sinoallii TaxID=1463999 RepID=UPI0019028CC5|nr:uncharacterized protein EAF02_000889 [Botrytis sinoallii]KAF7893351.1 hypothetical protein EAF02_000889 [Botrytis sinoallii]
MADNLCGPSNALQNFQKHSNVDRTLQQDRLVGRAPSSQGFRASPGPNAGQGWANDFQNMSISGPQAQFQQQGVNQTIQPQMGAGWHQEFAQSHGAPGMIAQGNQPIMAMNRPSMMNAGYNPMPRVLMQQNQFASTSQSLVENNEVFDEAAFARAFEQAANAESERAQQQELESQAASVQHEETHTMDHLHVTKEAESELERAEKQLLGQSLLGADTIQDPATATSEQNIHAPDALSRTAGELLSSVSNNQSEKFQNSQFLQLMRQFRDKEVTVEGDEVVDGPMKAKKGDRKDGGGQESFEMIMKMAQKTGETAMNVQAIAALSNAEHNEQKKLAREKYQSAEEKQKQHIARDRLTQIMKMLPKQDKETAGFVRTMGGIESRVWRVWEMVRGEGGVEEGDIEEEDVEEGDVEEEDVGEGDVEAEGILRRGISGRADIGERDVEEWGIDLLTYLQKKEQRYEVFKNSEVEGGYWGVGY